MKLFNTDMDTHENETCNETVGPDPMNLFCCKFGKYYHNSIHKNVFDLCQFRRKLRLKKFLQNWVQNFNFNIALTYFSWVFKDSSIWGLHYKPFYRSNLFHVFSGSATPTLL